MNLLEYEGKALLSRHAIATPSGALWPDLPEGVQDFMVKAQVPTGKRGKAGGVRRAASARDVKRIVDTMLGGDFAGFAVERVYVEEHLPIEKEVYLAVAVDRERGCHTVIFSGEGGMDIEDVADDRIVRMPIDPWLGFRSFHSDRLCACLEVGQAARHLGDIAEALYRLALEEDAELIEINPLAVVGDRLVAADAKFVLDDNARFRHADWSAYDRDGHRTPVEERIAQTGAVGVEIDPDGDVVAVVSGAGLMMATLDLLVSAGHRVRAVVDLGGTVLSGSEGLEGVLAAIAGAKPRATFVNAFLQTAHCDVFAEGLAVAHEHSPLHGRIVVRLKGRNAQAGRDSLTPLGFEVHEDLWPAIDALSQHKA